MTVEVLAITPSTNAGNIRAFVTIKIGEVTIHGLKVVQAPGQAAWCALPSKEYTSREGQRRFAPIIEITGPLKEAVSKAVLAAWQRAARTDRRLVYADTGEQ
jgi:DNA-binding cell septation regulator SpoVG